MGRAMTLGKVARTPGAHKCRCTVEDRRIHQAMSGLTNTASSLSVKGLASCVLVHRPKGSSVAFRSLGSSVSVKRSSKG